jgi:hypothetical protein
MVAPFPSLALLTSLDITQCPYNDSLSTVPASSRVLLARSSPPLLLFRVPTRRVCEPSTNLRTGALPSRVAAPAWTTLAN